MSSSGTTLLTSPVQSPADKREYAALKLANGLRVLLISDPQITNDDVISEQKHRDIGEPADETGMAVPVLSDASTSEDSGSICTDEEVSGSDSDQDNHVRTHHPREHAPAKQVKRAAAALSVGVGFYSDPLHLQGLTHYLEHMLFMGSEKYPDENDYDAYLSSHSGSSNACTEEETTTFHFDCAPHALAAALDRFAQFFVSPLVKADALEREVLAVDNEFTGVYQSDGCRLMQFRAHTARDGHPAKRFGWGNRATLMEQPAKQGVDVRAELLCHYHEQYSAERMNLVVLSGESVETLRSWVEERFNAVPDGKGPRVRYESAGGPYGPGSGLANLHILPAVRDDHRLSLLFQFPCLEKAYQKKIEDYLSHLLGHEGSGSLLAYLKARGWATELCAGVMEQTSAAFVFDVTITLTEAGLCADAGCGLAAAGAMFEYLSMLRNAGPQRWAWDEMAMIADMKWKFLEEEDAADYAAQVAADMHVYPLDHVLVGAYLHQDYDPEMITHILNEMRPETARIDLQTKKFEECRAALVALTGSAHKVVEGEEPYFKTPFMHINLPEHVLTTWAAEKWSPELTLPPRNPYLPTDFALRSEEVKSLDVATRDATNDANGNVARDNDENLAVLGSMTPYVVLDVPGLRVWYKLDRTFRVPRTAAYFRLSCPAAYTSPRAAAAGHLVVKLLEDALCEEAYLADVAGLHYGVWFEGSSGIDFKVDGFSHKLPLLTELIFRTLATLTIEEDAFKRVQEALVRSYNANMKPLKQSTFLRLRTLKANLYDMEAVRAEMEALSAKDLRTFLPQLLSAESLHLETLILGNASQQEASAIGEAARAALSAVGPVAPGDRTLQIPDGTAFLLRAPTVNPDEDNSAIEIYFQCGDGVEARQRALLDFVDQLVHEPCYDTLRTKEQLGYTVASGHRLTHGVVGLAIVVQSGVHGPKHLDNRVDAFLETFLGRLRDMPEEDFERNRQALIADKLMKDRNLTEEADKTWDVLVNRAADFQAKQAEIAALREISQAEILEYFQRKLAPGGSERRRLAVHVGGRQHRKEVDPGGPALPGVTEVIFDPDVLKAELPFYPPVGHRIL